MVILITYKISMARIWNKIFSSAWKPHSNRNGLVYTHRYICIKQYPIELFEKIKAVWGSFIDEVVIEDVVNCRGIGCTHWYPGYMYALVPRIPGVRQVCMWCVYSWSRVWWGGGAQYPSVSMHTWRETQSPAATLNPPRPHGTSYVVACQTLPIAHNAGPTFFNISPTSQTLA